VAHHPHVTAGIRGEARFDGCNDATLERIERFPSRSQVEHGILQQDALWHLGMFDQYLLELLELPPAAVPLDQILRVGNLRSGRFDERRDRLPRSSEGGAVDRGR